MLLSLHFPAGEVFDLLLRQRIDLHPHAGEFEVRDFLVDHRRDRIDLLLQLLVILHQVLSPERLVRDAHVHDAGGMALGCC